jgi:predicted NAD/FAD-dependent oxidoreductase
LKNPNTPWNILDNLVSGALPPPDMFLVGFTLLDLASQPFHRSTTLDHQTVNGFLYSRSYATMDCAELHNTILNEIWSISSSDTSATAYKDFTKHALGCRGVPFAWLLRGSLEEMLIQPWLENLKRHGCNIKSSVSVTGVEIGSDGRIQLNLSDKTHAIHENIVFAVPAPELAKLVLNGSSGRCVVDHRPELSELQRLRTANILVVTVVFKERLPDLPSEHVGLAQSLGYLTFIDISQLWKSLRKEKHTVLVLAASDANQYPPARNEDWAHLMIRELAAYVPAVKPGDRWGDAQSNIEYSRSFPQNNRSHTLFLNDMNSEHFVLEPSYDDLPGVFFAGDFCSNEVKMATVESAVLSGLHAACAVQVKVQGKSDITIEPSRLPSSGEFAAAKLVLLPLAYGALAWSAVNVALQGLGDGQNETPEKALTPATTLALIPLRFIADWVLSLENLGIALLSSSGDAGSLSPVIQHGFRATALATLAASESFVSERAADKSRGLASLLTDMLKAMSVAANAPSRTRPQDAEQARRSAFAEGRGLLRGSGRFRPNVARTRRHRAKL